MKKWLKRLKKDERGLTLVELLAVVVILAIVAAIAFISIGNVIENSKKDAHVANALQVISAAKLYEASSGEITTLKVNALDTIGELVDPWTKDEYSVENLNAAEVSKDDDEYTIKFDADANKCNIESSESDLRKDGREACKED